MAFRVIRPNFRGPLFMVRGAFENVCIKVGLENTRMGIFERVGRMEVCILAGERNFEYLLHLSKRLITVFARNCEINCRRVCSNFFYPLHLINTQCKFVLDLFKHSVYVYRISRISHLSKKLKRALRCEIIYISLSLMYF